MANQPHSALTDSTDREGPSRRSVLSTTAAVAGIGIAGCLGDEEETGSDEPLEVLHGWTGGDGEEAIAALIEGFESEHPDVETEFNAVGAEANIQLNDLVVQRVSSNDPPSSWAAWNGKHLEPFVEDDMLGDITEDVWEENGLEDVFREEAKELSRFDGQYVCVPVGSHRLNNLFYNVAAVEEAGIDPVEDISSVDDYVDALATIDQETDTDPMVQALTTSNTQLSLWAQTHLGSQGYESYMDVMNGDGNVDDVTKSLEYVAEFGQYFNEDADSVNPPESNERIMNGDAAFLQQGNWMAGGYRANDLAYGEDWGWIPFPGTENMYTLHFDTFVYPADNPSPEAAKTWLSYCGSAEAQVEFNKRKGSIPPRTDTSDEEFGEFLQQTMEDFASVEHQPPTVAHGLAVSSGALSDLRAAFNNHFMGPFDVEEAAQAIIEATADE